MRDGAIWGEVETPGDLAATQRIEAKRLRVRRWRERTTEIEYVEWVIWEESIESENEWEVVTKEEGNQISQGLLFLIWGGWKSP